MGSMGAALAGASSAGAAGVASMSGMGSRLPFVSRLMEALGLGALNSLPDTVLRPVLIAVLALAIGTALVGFLGHRRPQVLLVTVLSATVTYPSIYLWMSEPLYIMSLAGMLAGGVWGVFLARSSQGIGVTSGGGAMTDVETLALRVKGIHCAG
ncbi:MAG: hypothetical protein HY688_03160 [Chloroflexi bacterium]|nr:hypothetical protein [Chloroflexota bacterium]